MHKEYKCRILEIDGARNVRDLGGYKVHGGWTSYGRFLRSGQLSSLSDLGVQQLLEAGVDCVVDLRSRFECESKPSCIGAKQGVDVFYVPMLDFVHSEIAQGLAKLPESLEEIYLAIIEKGQQDFKQLFEIFAADYNCILFHCTAGKDRTGISAMLLLWLAGVGEETILEDYSYSYELNRLKAVEGIPEYLLYSDKSTLKLAIDTLKQQYGGVLQYLSAAGVTGEQQAAIRKKLVDIRE